MDIKVAILVDGGFYRKRSKYLWGEKTPKERADELFDYCMKHVQKDKFNECYLYRIFYYDCPPSAKKVYNPLKKSTEDFALSDQYKWMTEFLNELTRKRKFALRLGRLSEDDLFYTINQSATKKLINKTKAIDDLEQKDLALSITQKGVDMKIGVDITSMAFRRQADRMILISGDSDFVPAAKQARREGVDFILDPMGQSIKSDLNEHIDGIISFTNTLRSKHKECRLSEIHKLQ